jgi:hypothetical protein
VSVASILHETIVVTVVAPLGLAAMPLGMIKLAVAQPDLALAVITGGHGAGLVAFSDMVNRGLAPTA